MYNIEKPARTMLVGVPTLGIIRMEWHVSLTSAIIPTNWQTGWSIPFGYLTDDGQNIVCHTALANNIDWLLFIEDDVLIPPDIFVKMERWIRQGDIPIISGLYHLKNSPDREPILYKGRGNGAFRNFKYGEAVWVDGVPTGCLLIHMSIIRELAKRAEHYEVRNPSGSVVIKRIFEAPRKFIGDPALGGYKKMIGTSDLFFCDTLIEQDIFKAAGWPKLSRRKFPILCDTSIVCDHIDRATGQRW